MIKNNHHLRQMMNGSLYSHRHNSFSETGGARVCMRVKKAWAEFLE
jgi:hypothetical protein